MKWNKAVQGLIAATFGPVMAVAILHAQPRPEPPKFTFVSPAQEMQIGQQAFQDILNQSSAKISHNPEHNRRVAEMLERMTPYANTAVRDWQFVVIEDDTPNAFALPGSRVAVQTGMFKIADTDDMLAAVIGHEIAHVELRHAARRMDSQIGVNLVGGLIGQATKGDKFSNLYNNLYAFGAKGGVLLPYSRKHELESDQLGVWYMAKAGYDPRAAATLWKRMTKAGGKKPPEWLSTHPTDSRRVQEIEEYLPFVMPIYEETLRGS